MSTARRALAVTGAAALALTGALVAAPAASAQPEGRDAPMAHPFDGTHIVRFGAFNVCHWPNGQGNGPGLQALNANAYDTSIPVGAFPFDLSVVAFPFNSATVEWTHDATGQTGRQNVQTVGKEVGVRDLPTPAGDLTVTITVTRSGLPTLAPGSAAPGLSDTHSETFHVPGQFCAV